MGYSTTQIDKETALKMAQGKEVIEASDISYFQSNYWKGRIDNVEYGDNGRLYFNLINGDFITVKL